MIRPTSESSASRDDRVPRPQNHAPNSGHQWPGGGDPAPLDFGARDTPLQPLDRLGTELGLSGGRLWVKRDDLTGLTGGGNKARKLEYLVAAAIDQGCDTLVTTGAAQSNHVRATAAAAASLGLGCVAVLSTLKQVHEAEGNLLLDDLFDARVVWTEPKRRAETMSAVMGRLKESGRRPYSIPLGGTNAIGTTGYVTAAHEIEAELPGATVICAAGTGGTHAGLVVGLGSFDRVLGFDIAASVDLTVEIPRVVSETTERLGIAKPGGSLNLDQSQAKVPYGAPTRGAKEAIRLTARTTGLVLDPVYTGRTMAGFTNLIRNQSLPDTPLVFLHSGGLPALFTGRYQEWFSVPSGPF